MLQWSGSLKLELMSGALIEDYATLPFNIDSAVKKHASSAPLLQLLRPAHKSLGGVCVAKESLGEDFAMQ